MPIVIAVDPECYPTNLLGQDVGEGDNLPDLLGTYLLLLLEVLRFSCCCLKLRKLFLREGYWLWVVWIPLHRFKLRVEILDLVFIE